MAAALLVDAHGVLPSSLPPLEPSAALEDIDKALATPVAEARAAAADRKATITELKQPDTKRAKTAATTAPTQPDFEDTACHQATALTLTSGEVVAVSPADSWGVVGLNISIPESAWGAQEGADTLGRYTIVGLAASVSPPAYVVRLLRGALAESTHMVSPSVVKSMLPRGVKSKLGTAMKRPPVPTPARG